MPEKCFCHFTINGQSYAVKDATARAEIEALKSEETKEGFKQEILTAVNELINGALEGEY